MGGRDKGAMELVGKPMLQHIIDRIAPQLSVLSINANGDPARFAKYGLDIFPDCTGGHLGPLAGILSGMLWARKHTPQARLVATVSTDVPLLPLDLIAKLNAASHGDPDVIVLARSADRLHPVIGLWPVSLSGRFAAALHKGIRKLNWVTEHNHTISVDFPLTQISGSLVDPFFNVNTLEELQEVRQILSASKMFEFPRTVGA